MLNVQKFFCIALCSYRRLMFLKMQVYRVRWLILPALEHRIRWDHVDCTRTCTRNVFRTLWQSCRRRNNTCGWVKEVNRRCKIVCILFCGMNLNKLSFLEINLIFKSSNLLNLLWNIRFSNLLRFLTENLSVELDPLRIVLIKSPRTWITDSLESLNSPGSYSASLGLGLGLKTTEV